MFLLASRAVLDGMFSLL